MSIDAVDPQVFLHLLELIYTGETQEKEGSGLKLNQIIEDLLAFQHLVPLDLIAQLDKHRTTIGSIPFLLPSSSHPHQARTRLQRAPSLPLPRVFLPRA